MDKNLLLARANLRKAKGQTVAIIVLVLLASVMMNLWLMLSTDYRKNFDRVYDELNDGHVNIAAIDDSDEFKDFTGDLLKNRSDVTEFCLTDAFVGNGSFDYNGGEVNSNFVFLDKETAASREVGRIEITEDNGKSGLYLPLLYSVSYAVGDEIEITFGNEKLKYTVCGFTNSASIGSHNCVMCALVLSEDEYGALSEKTMIRPATLASIRLDDISKSESAETEIKDALTEKFPNASVGSNSYSMISVSRYIAQTVCAAILSAMAVLITLIAVVVISSNVVNYVQENMQNLGALKAIGYKSSQLIAAQITQFALVALITAAVGAALSYFIFPGLNDMMISQTGIPYEVRFLPIPFIITLVFMTVVVAAAVFLSAKRIRKIEPIMALRNGVMTHSFKKNRVALDKTSAPLNFALALKNVLSEKKRNITVVITTLVLSLVIVFAGVMLENFAINQENFINIIVGVSADSCIGVSPEVDEELRAALENDERTEKFYLYTTETYVTAPGDVSLMASVCDDCSKIGNQNAVVEGRFPKFDNEVAVAIKYAREEGIKVGDEISLKAASNEEKYIVSGFTQLSNNLGKDCLLTREGMERISELSVCNYYIDVKDGVDVDKFNEDVTEGFSDKVSMLVNQQSILEGSSQVYISLVTMIVIAVLILSAIVVAFVLYLLVRTMLNNKKRDYGIYKALGFTTGQLVRQTALSFMPPLIISAVIGIAVGSIVINPLLALFLGGIGIVKCTFTVPLVFNIIAGIGLVLFAFGAACLLSSRVKKIAPRELLVGE